ncbi:MAG: NAD(P)-binding domain-containing protein [Burkholderiales bacterium]|nr:NAD(P)-binding domain-containing protein [Burkholderiales bacterium]
MNDRIALPVAVIGAGPVGLAAAAHMLERGLRPVVFEAGATVAANLESFRHVRLFSPWRYNVDRAARRLLESAGWQPPPDEELPTAGEIVDRYLAPLAALPPIAAALQLSSRVESIARDGFDKLKSRGRDEAPFVLRVRTASGVREHRAWAVLDATGTWATPNPLGANGLPALGEREHADRIAYGMPDILGAQRARYAGRRVVVAGAGHSAAGNLLALAKLAQTEPGTRIVWTIRGHDFARIFGGGENDGLAARGALGARLRALVGEGRLEVRADFKAEAIRDEGGPLAIEGRAPDGSRVRIDAVDEIIVSTGCRPDLGLSSEIRVRLDPWLESTEALAPLIDPNEHSCGTVRPHGHRELAHPEARFYALGAKSYGRAPNFLLATGYEQARSVAAALAGDLASADDVQLELPQTGVCSTQFDEAAGACCAKPETPVEAPIAASSCCGGPPKSRADACCVRDEVAKDEGKSGCGCGAEPKPSGKVIEASCC